MIYAKAGGGPKGPVSGPQEDNGVGSERAGDLRLILPLEGAS